MGILSPRPQRKKRKNSNENFLSDQKLKKEQQAKVERLARIQRRMCGDEKKMFRAPDKNIETGRKKIVSPVKSPFRTRAQKKLQFVDDEEEEKDVPIFLSKSIQTKPEVLTPKMNKAQ